MEFQTYSVNAFNKEFGTALNGSMSFYDATQEIELKAISYFYVSLNDSDVLEAIESEREVADQLGLSLIFIDSIGIYIAVY